MSAFKANNQGSPKPEIALNQSGEDNVARALNDFLRYASEGLAGETHLDIVTAYFDVGGYAQLADALNQIDGVRLLLGVEPYPPAPRPRVLGDGRKPTETTEQQKLVQALDDLDSNIKWGRDMLGFTPETSSMVSGLLTWLRSGRVKVRKLENRFLHGKAFIVGSGSHGVVAGSSNFTRAGLTTNIELNLGNYSPTIVDQVQEFFDNLWAQAQDYDLTAIFDQEFELHSPYLIYLRMLWEQYRNEVYDGDSIEDETTLIEFQLHGVERARKILAKYHGVLIADEVGLGKTFIAGELIREAAENRQRVLVVAPAALRDGMWHKFLYYDNDFGKRSAELISYEELAGGKLDKQLDEFAHVVVDEAHYLRNPKTQRAEVFHKLLDCFPRKKLILLTATPVNNSLDDLYHLLSYFLRYDTDLSEVGVRSLKQRFAEAQKLSPDELTPKHLFNVIDAVAVRRMRHFIKKHYPDAKIPRSNSDQIIQFPKTNVQAVPYELDDVLPKGFFRKFKKALDPQESQSLDNPEVLTLARYTPSRYLKSESNPVEETELLHENRLAGLMRSLLLKRFESSPYAFAKSCKKMAGTNDIFMEMLGQGVVASKKMLAEYIATDSDELTLDELSTEHFEDSSQDASLYDVKLLRSHVERDSKILRSFEVKAKKVTQEQDPTLQALVSELEYVISETARNGIDDLNARNKRKVLIFSYYSDTVDWIYQHLLEVSDMPNSALMLFRGRIAKITGSDGMGEKQKVLLGFAPATAGTGKEKDEYDIVVTTDVLAEGVNLQQARHIINYDLPWNPTRLIQRHGRIDRIGSLHEEIFIRCVLPDSKLDELLRLQERLQDKIKQAASTVGAPQTLPFGEREEVNFADTREEIKRIRKGDATFLENAGTATSSLSGEEFRQELRKALADNEMKGKIENLAWRSGSAMKIPLAGIKPGFIFCLQIGDQPIPQFCFVEAGKSGVKFGHSDTLECLFLACPPDGVNTPAVPLDLDVDHKVYDAWEVACEKIIENWNYYADKANVESKIERPLREAAEMLRKYPPCRTDQETLNKAIDSIQAPLSERHVKQFRKIIRDCKDNPQICAENILKEIEHIGLKPYEPPPPNPVITKDDIHLICWLSIDNTNS